MYNYGTAAEVLETVFDVIEGGKAVEAANVAEVIADNGAKIFDITTAETFAANGSAATIGSTVSMAEGATAGVTAGAGVVTMSIADAAAAVAPALGVAALGVAGGFALYNLAPEFWTNLSNELTGQGQTVNGKVVGLMTPDGTTALSLDTINIIKNALINANAFQSTVDELTNFDVDGLTISPSVYCYTFPQGTGTFQYVTCPWKIITNGHTYTEFSVGVESPSRIVKLLAIPFNDTTFDIMIVSNTSEQIYFNYKCDGSMASSAKGFDQFSYNQRTVYYSRPSTSGLVGWDDMNGLVQGWFSTSPNNIGEIAYAALYGEMTGNAPIQPNATLPQPNVSINITYPDWLPLEFPDTLPVEMPDYYPVSMPSEGITQDPAQQGANETSTQLNKLIELIFQSLPENAPQIEPDPDPSPEPEPEPELAPPSPEPNPPDPNPPVPTPIGTIPIPTLDTTSADRMFTVYNPTDGNVNSLGAFLWTSNVIEQIKKLWDDPMQAIISFHKIYGAPTVGSSQEIVLGYIESGVSAPVVTSQFCDVDCGSVTVPELLNNATSYAPFTSLHIYLPFIGIMELDTNECMKATLHVKYRIDVYTGTCVALIYVSRNPDLTNEQVLYTFSGNASQQLPLTSSSFGGAISALLGLAGAGVAVASGGALGVAAGAVSAAHSLTQEMVHINRSGGLSANAGILGSRTPYLILSRQYCSDANGYAGFYGYPSNKTVYIGNCNGYIKCKDVIFRGSCTQAEAEEIESLLKSGVYV